MPVYTSSRILIERFPHRADLMAAILDVCRCNAVTTGVFSVIGAVTRATVGFYDQTGRSYSTLVFDEPAEILSCTGNISALDGAPFVHAHIVLGYADGSVRGGHLMDGTILFAGEFHCTTLDGTPPSRAFDDVTGLKLWKL